MADTVQQEDLAKAIAALQDIAKGHSSGSTATTAVESMRDGSVGAGSSSGATQVHHTPNNSDRASWAGSSWDAVADNGPGADSVKEDGTDYKDQGKVMKSILDKLAKGGQLTPAEFAFVQKATASTVEKALLPPPAKGAGKDEKPSKDDEDDDGGEFKGKKGPPPPMAKSLSDFAAEDGSVSKGLEVSEFLASFAGVISKSLEAMEERIVARVTGQQVRSAEATGTFQKSLAEAVVNLGEAITAVATRQQQLEAAPARAPKALQNIQLLEKGAYEGPAEPLSKALVTSTLISLVEEGKAAPGDVIRYESTNVLSPQLEAKVRAAVGR